MEWKVKSFQELSVEELYAILQLRAQVFVVEQDCVYQDVDDKDFNSYHVCGYDAQKLTSYARIVHKGVSYAELSIGRVVVSPQYRGIKLGVELMNEALSFVANQHGPEPIRISAQSHLRKFYADLGFVFTGKEYLEDGIPHIEMLRTLNS